MNIICIRAESGGLAGVEECVVTLVEVAPRVAVSADGVVWLDARGVKPETAVRAAAAARRRLERASGEVWCAGVGPVPVAAFVAAGSGGGGGGGGGGDGAEGDAEAEAGRVAGAERVIVAEGSARRYLAGRRLAELGVEPRLALLLEGVGIERCGELAALDREAVEVRFGVEGVTLWRWARGEDERHFFGAPVKVAEGASLDFVDYVVTDPERLVFTTNALLGSVCDALTARGAHARGIRLRLSLADGGMWERTLRSARPTASRVAWLRLVRGELERLTVPDAVAGIAVTVEREEAAGAVQGDLFDPGFGSAAAVESALTRLIETGASPVVHPRVDAHPLVERSARFEVMAPEAALAVAERRRVGGAQEVGAEAARAGGDALSGYAANAANAANAASAANAGDDALSGFAAGLTLQVLPTPRRVTVETESRRDHEVPVRYRDGGWKRIVTAAGPDRISGGQWEEGYAREYYRGVDEEGTLVWLYRDGCDARWYLHGWWD